MYCVQSTFYNKKSDLHNILQFYIYFVYIRLTSSRLLALMKSILIQFSF